MVDLFTCIACKQDAPVMSTITVKPHSDKMSYSSVVFLTLQKLFSSVVNHNSLLCVCIKIIEISLSKSVRKPKFKKKKE